MLHAGFVCSLSSCSCLSAAWVVNQPNRCPPHPPPCCLHGVFVPSHVPNTAVCLPACVRACVLHAGCVCPLASSCSFSAAGLVSQPFCGVVSVFPRRPHLVDQPQGQGSGRGTHAAPQRHTEKPGATQHTTGAQGGGVDLWVCKRGWCHKLFVHGGEAGTVVEGLRGRNESWGGPWGWSMV